MFSHGIGLGSKSSTLSTDALHSEHFPAHVFSRNPARTNVARKQSERSPKFATPLCGPGSLLKIRKSAAQNDRICLEHTPRKLVRRFLSANEPGHRPPGGVALAGFIDVRTHCGVLVVGGEQEGAVEKCPDGWSKDGG